MTEKQGSTMRGAIHVHSSLSHDGVYGLQDLRGFFQGKGFQFVCLTDHSQDVTVTQFLDLQNRCRILSDSSFLFIPGLEYSCAGYIHIMGIGIQGTTSETDPFAVVNHIQSSGGIAVLAHPIKSRFSYESEWVKKLDGVEIWNLAADGKFLPQVASINAYQKMRSRSKRLHAFYGIDYHRAFHDLAIEVDVRDLETDVILKSLREGQFGCTSPLLSMTSSPDLGYGKLLAIGIPRMILNSARMLRHAVCP